MVTELTRYNLGVAFFKTLISRSYLINFLIAGGSVLVARVHCLNEFLNGENQLLMYRLYKGMKIELFTNSEKHFSGCENFFEWHKWNKSTDFVG